MAEQKTFRSAFNGFNREDVVHYIEYMNAKHQAQVNELTAEIDFLRTQQRPEADTASVEELEEKLRVALAEKYQAETQRDAAIAEKEQAQTALAELEATSARVAEQQTSATSRAEEELEAYRRAERTERVARERAEKVYHTVNGVLADATVKVDDAAARISELTDMVCAQLSDLQSAVASSKEALKDAAETMYTIRPNAEEE